MAEANHFLQTQYLAEFNARFKVKASERGSAFVPLRRTDLNLIFSLHHERTVARDNTVAFANRSWQIERTKLRGSLAGCRVILHEHLDGTFSITFGPHLVGHFADQAVEMTPPRKATKALASRRGLEKSGQRAA